MISNEWLQKHISYLEDDQLAGRKWEIEGRRQEASALKELLRLRTLIPLAGRLVSECNEKLMGSRASTHLELEIEKYRKDFQR